jgi:hypothetical protein
MGTNTNAFIVFTCHCEPEGRGNPTQGRCEGTARGNLKSSLALLGTRLCRFTPRNDKLFNGFVLSKGGDHGWYYRIWSISSIHKN